jgi:hypothetical protein
MAKQKTDLQVFQEWVQELTGFVFGTEEKSSKWKEPKQHDFSYPITEYAIEKEKKKRKRARKKDGTFRGDDKSTPDVNEAWENE